MANRDFFDKVQNKTNVSQDQLKNVANSIKPQDLKDEKKVRELVSKIGSLAGVPVSKQKEDQIVNFLVKQKLNPQQMQTMIQQFMKPKK
ncbi:stage VI sporulation protein F [Caldalkalibacillus salinus]|uniref:stage VI sporulation protein F n=1 Tax=Caldalkalibacillus salinus TaxID=2803787 RepID=UPI0019245E04|nr:stage VI sporulation protein F [Caldalkalibacillus salinus]